MRALVWKREPCQYYTYGRLHAVPPIDNRQGQPVVPGWELFRWNLAAASLHAVQCLIVLITWFAKLSNIQENVPYVSGVQELRYISHAMVGVNSTDSRCYDVRNSPAFRNVASHASPMITFSEDLLPHRLYNFAERVLIEYKVTGYWINSPLCICAFFFLSSAFQFTNGYLLNMNPEQPRLLHYLEYSISSSLIIMVMAVQVGVLDIFTLTSLFALFFGMNLFGACAELAMFVAETKVRDPTEPVIWGWSSAHLWLLPHLAGWVVFFFALIPILINYHRGVDCSDSGAGPPWYITIAIYGEVIFFLFFGVVQIYGLYKRTDNVFKQGNSSQERDRIIYTTDAMNIGASFVAKTSLCWLLLGPALSAKNI